MVSSESIHTSNITQTEKVIVRNMYVYTYKYIATTVEKRRHEFKRESEEGLEGGKGKRE